MVGQVARLGLALEQRGTLGRREPLTEAERARVLRSCLAVRTERGCLLAGRGRILEHGVGVPRSLCVVCEPGQIDVAPVGRICKDVERFPMQVDAPVRRHRLLECEPGELVPEHDTGRLRGEHAGRQALVEVIDHAGGESLEQPELGMLRHDRGSFEERLGRKAQPCRTREHRVADRPRDLLGFRGKRLDDEERVPGRPAVELSGVDAVRLGKQDDGLRRERAQADAVHRSTRRELSEHHPKRMATVELVVSIGGEDERRNSLDLPGEQPQHVERRLVGPVHVFEDEHGGLPLQLTHEPCCDLIGSGSARQELRELAAGVLGDLEHRSQRPRGEERIASPPEDPHRASARVAESPHERALAHSSFAADEHDAPPGAALDRVQPGIERRKLALALEQLSRAARGVSANRLVHISNGALPRAIGRAIERAEAPQRTAALPPSATSSSLVVGSGERVRAREQARRVRVPEPDVKRDQQRMPEVETGPRLRADRRALDL